jgi:hypothetical protein
MAFMPFCRSRSITSIPLCLHDLIESKRVIYAAKRSPVGARIASKAIMPHIKKRQDQTRIERIFGRLHEKAAWGFLIRSRENPDPAWRVPHQLQSGHIV